MRAKFGRGPTVVSKKGSLKFISRFSDNLFIFNHSITLESSAFIKDSLVSILFPKYAKLLNLVVSSA